MKNEPNQKLSLSLKKVWRERYDEIMKKRNQTHTLEKQEQQSQRIKLHFVEHPEHRVAISLAQKRKWAKYKKALNYCTNAGITFGEDSL